MQSTIERCWVEAKHPGNTRSPERLTVLQALLEVELDAGPLAGAVPAVELELAAGGLE